MDNLARKDELAQEFGSFLHMISSISDVKALDQMCHEFLYRQAPQRGLELAAGMSWANPFFLPDIPAQAMDIETEYGHLQPGAVASFVHLSDARKVRSTWIGGAEVYRR